MSLIPNVEAELFISTDTDTHYLKGVRFDRSSQIDMPSSTGYYLYVGLAGQIENEVFSAGRTGDETFRRADSSTFSLEEAQELKGILLDLYWSTRAGQKLHPGNLAEEDADQLENRYAEIEDLLRKKGTL